MRQLIDTPLGILSIIKCESTPTSAKQVGGESQGLDFLFCDVENVAKSSTKNRLRGIILLKEDSANKACATKMGRCK